MTNKEIRGNFKGKCTDLIDIQSHGINEFFTDEYVFWLEEQVSKNGLIADVSNSQCDHEFDVSRPVCVKCGWNRYYSKPTY